MACMITAFQGCSSTVSRVLAAYFALSFHFGPKFPVITFSTYLIGGMGDKTIYIDLKTLQSFVKKKKKDKKKSSQTGY